MSESDEHPYFSFDELGTVLKAHDSGEALTGTNMLSVHNLCPLNPLPPLDNSIQTPGCGAAVHDNCMWADGSVRYRAQEVKQGTVLEIRPGKCEMTVYVAGHMLRLHLGGVAGSGGAALLKHRLEGRQRLRGHAWADAIVLAHHNVLLVALHTLAMSATAVAYAYAG